MLALGGFLAVAPSGQDELLNRIIGMILLAFGALALLYALICEFLIAREGRLSPEEWNREEAERRIREGIEQAAKMQALYGAGTSNDPPDTTWPQ